MSPDCRPEWISAYIDGELSPAETAWVIEHLQGCKICQRTLSAFGQASDAFARSLPDPADDLVNRAVAGLSDLPRPFDTPRGYAALGVWSAIGVAIGGLAFQATLFPATARLWRVLKSLAAIFWTAGTGQLLTPAGWLRLAGLVLLFGFLGGLTIYGTRVLDRPGEVSS